MGSFLRPRSDRPRPKVRLTRASAIVGTSVSGTFTLAVPEPPTWTVLMVGFVGLGYVGHSRSKRRRLAAPP
jgi:hypothetical protein